MGLARWVRFLAGAAFAATLLVGGLAMGDAEFAATVAVDEFAGTLGLSGPVAVRICLCLSITLIAGAQLVFMCILVDDLCPEAPMGVTGFLKIMAGAASWGALATATKTWMYAIHGIAAVG